MIPFLIIGFEPSPEEGVRYSVGHARVSALPTRDWGDRVVDFLRRRHGLKVAECVSAEAGIPVSTVTKWLERASNPSGYAYMALARAYGPRFLAATMDNPPDWIVRAAREEEASRIDEQIAELQHRRATL